MYAMRALCNRNPQFAHSVCTTGISLTHLLMSKLLSQVFLRFNSKALNFLMLVKESVFLITSVTSLA